MYQDIEVIECLASESDSDQAVNSIDRTPLTAKKLAELLGTTERTIFKYANRLLEAWHWLPESEFRTDGIYTDKALTEMRRLKAIGKSSEYAKAVAIENQKPATQQATIKATSAIVPVRHTEALETKLATIQKNTTALTISVQDRITTIKDRIATEANRTKTNQTVLDELEAQQAIARGIEKGLKIFELEQQAAAATVEQLTLEKLQQG
jgi:predicted transcriptional regulator